MRGKDVNTTFFLNYVLILKNNKNNTEQTESFWNPGNLHKKWLLRDGGDEQNLSQYFRPESVNTGVQNSQRSEDPSILYSITWDNRKITVMEIRVNQKKYCHH